METEVLARKLPKKPDPIRKPVGVNIKGDLAWREWLERGAAHCRVSVSALVDIAVAKHLKAEGFVEKPPDRLS